MEKELIKLGSNLRNIRIEKHIIQGDIARSLNVGRGYVSKVENGKTNPTLSTIAKLAKAVGVSSNKLLE